jgi:hypothetical protein
VPTSSVADGVSEVEGGVDDYSELSGDPTFQLRGDGSGDPDSPCSGFREQSMPSKKRKRFERPKKHRRPAG